MAKELIRQLRADEIECRVGSINEKGVTLLIYKDSRVDMKILDEVFGPLGWQRKHEVIDGNLYCTISVYDKETGQWISRQDVGSAGFTEKEKSQAADSFKRAAVLFGIGRELYTSPLIWIPSNKCDLIQRGEKFYCNNRFKVLAIDYGKNKEITGLTIVNEKGTVVFEMKRKEEKNTEESKLNSQLKDGLTEQQTEALYAEMDRTGVEMMEIEERYGVSNVDDITPEIYRRLMNSLKKTRTRVA